MLSRALTFAVLLLCSFLSVGAWAQTAEQFFAGNVTELTAEQLTVSRVIQGKAETRVFRITPETKVEGPLAPHVRVTVGYDGDRATLVIVREDNKEKK